MPVKGTRSSYEPGSLDYETACIGFDLGTTGGRACFLSNAPPENVWSSDPIDDPFRSDSDVNFQASVNPFPSTRESWTRVREDVERLPLKFGVYIAYILELRSRLDASDYEAETRINIPQVDNFLCRYDTLALEEQRATFQRLERAFLDFLLRVKAQCELKAESQHCKINRLIVTVPSVWTKWMQAYYAVCLTTVWQLSYDAIDIIYESEAIANFLLGRSEKLLRFANKTPKILVSIDLGGHTLNMNRYHIKTHPSNPHQVSAYGMASDTCIHGGLELHKALVQRRILHDMESGKLRPPKDQEMAVYTGLIQNYLTEYRKHVDGKEYLLTATPTVDRVYQIKFEAEEAQGMYERCFYAALEEVSLHLKEVSKEQMSSEAEVVLTGGSFRNDHLVKEVKKEISRWGFRFHDATQSNFYGKEAGIVANGAGLALLSTITVHEFMIRACFAVQTSKNGQSPDAVLWKNGRSRTARVLLPGTQGATQFVTCCPVADSNDAAEIDAQSTYKIIALPQLQRGEYDIEMEYKQSSLESDSDTIMIYCTRASVRDKPRGKPKLTFPIYYDCGPRACFEDVEKRPPGPAYRRRIEKTLGNHLTQTFDSTDAPMSEWYDKLGDRLRKKMAAWEAEDAKAAEMQAHKPSRLKLNVEKELLAAPTNSKAQKTTHRRNSHAPSSNDTTVISERSSSAKLHALIEATGEEKRWTLGWWVRLKATFSPPKPGYMRLFYTCSCGDVTYFDARETLPGGIEAIRRKLRASTSRVAAGQGASSATAPRLPPPAHTRSGNPEEPRTPRHLPAVRRSTSLELGEIENASAQIPLDQNQELQFLLLCINVKEIAVLLQLEVGSISCDEYLFREIRNAYEKIMEDHAWKPHMLLPQWVRKAASGARFASKILQTFSSIRLHRISSGDFVRFQLVPIRNTAHPTWFTPEFPPETEIIARRYIYEPVPIRSDIDNIPLAHLLKPGEHYDEFWLSTFPKKLREELHRPAGTMQPVIGWGIRIHQSLNWTIALSALLFMLILISVVVVAYSVVTGDASAAFGLGAYLAALLSIWLTYHYFSWKEAQ
ncbi:hypothetical protein PWT90_10548 [Aphanocladium album]|nr:hypothetical protein PWT90_10548 [Aphanocladium album]